MTVKQVTAWQCDKCRFISLYRTNVYRHKRTSCFADPELEACQTCQLLEYDPLESEESQYWCGGRDEELYTKVSNCPLWELGREDPIEQLRKDLGCWDEQEIHPEDYRRG